MDMRRNRKWVLYKGVFMYEVTKDHENNNVRPTPERIVETYNQIMNDYKKQK